MKRTRSPSHRPSKKKKTNQRDGFIQLHLTRNEQNEMVLSREQIDEIAKQCIKLSQENKITKENTWDLSLIDHIDYVLDSRDDGFNFQIASCAIDASLKIYSKRVESLHQNAYQMLGDLQRQQMQKKSSTNDDTQDTQRRYEKHRLLIKELKKLNRPETELESTSYFTSYLFKDKGDNTSISATDLLLNTLPINCNGEVILDPNYRPFLYVKSEPTFEPETVSLPKNLFPDGFFDFEETEEDATIDMTLLNTSIESQEEVSLNDFTLSESQETNPLPPLHTNSQPIIEPDLEFVNDGYTYVQMNPEAPQKHTHWKGANVDEESEEDSPFTHFIQRKKTASPKNSPKKGSPKRKLPFLRSRKHRKRRKIVQQSEQNIEHEISKIVGTPPKEQVALETEMLSQTSQTSQNDTTIELSSQLNLVELPSPNAFDHSSPIEEKCVAAIQEELEPTEVIEENQEEILESIETNPQLTEDDQTIQIIENICGDEREVNSSKKFYEKLRHFDVKEFKDEIFKKVKENVNDEMDELSTRFSTVMSSLNNFEGISTSLGFVCMLHLASEKGLELKEESLSDFKIILPRTS